jgi:hypothetical protein
MFGTHEHLHVTYRCSGETEDFGRQSLKMQTRVSSSMHFNMDTETTSVRTRHMSVL